MEKNRGHRGGGLARRWMERNRGYKGGTDFFVCFPSRMLPKSTTTNPSSHSPARIDSLKETSSRWRRKKQSSPMFIFPALARRSSCTSRKSSEKLSEVEEEPTSPKVTCIGQVRVKSKKNGNGIGSRSDSKKWGHMHEFRKDVCGMFKGIGSEFSCSLPCSGHSSTSPTTSKSSEHRKQHSSASRNTMLAKVFMVLQDEDDKGKLEHLDERDANSVRLAKTPFGEIGEPFEENREKLRRNLRRFRDDDDDDDDEEDWYNRRYNQDDVGGEDVVVEGETSVPPRNALLLMRCRSEPLKLSLDSDPWVTTPKSDESQIKKTCIVESDSKDSITSEDQDDSSTSIDVEVAAALVGDGRSEVKRSQESGEHLTNGLFLMQCEPELTKLSLEISKETWVSNGELFGSNDSHDARRRLSKESTRVEEEESSKAGRTEISEERLRPPKDFSLTRSKSNPLNVSMKLAPEASLWKRRSLGKPLSQKI